MEQTTDYELFKMKNGNRPINRNHVNKLKAKITKHGYLQSCAIIVNENMEIIDGQHRFVACQEMGLPIFYNVEEKLDQDMLIDLNISQRKWTLEDYVNYYANELEKPSYQRVLQMMSECKIPASAAILYAVGRDFGGEFLARVKRGTLLIDGAQYQQGKVRYDMITTLANILNTKVSDRFIRALLILEHESNFSWTTLLDKARKYRVKTYICTAKQEWVNMLVELYNYQCRSKKNLLHIEGRWSN